MTQVDDNYKWLEDVEGDRSLRWVASQNERTLNKLEGDPNYKEFFEEAKRILTAQDRIVYVQICGDYAYNFWNDEKHVRGLWRRTEISNYISGTPQWETVLDLDELAEREKENWIYRGGQVLAPQFKRCLLHLSRGGTDASVIREMDLVNKTFVKDGFNLPEAKSQLTWVDENHLLVGTQFHGEDSLTDSGYPRIAKIWKRGTPLGEAKTLLEGDQKDVSVSHMRLESGDQVVFLLYQFLDFFNAKYWLWYEKEKMELDNPSDALLYGFFKGHLIFKLQSDWRSHKAGSLISCDLDTFIKTGKLGQPINLFCSSETTSVGQVSISQNCVFVTYLDDVKGRLRAYDFKNEKWVYQLIEFPDNGSINIVSSRSCGPIVLIHYTNFIQPDSLYVLDDRKTQPQKIQTLPTRFDARHLKVEQKTTFSSDGTRIPYFLVSRKDLQLTGQNPTLLYGYGGFTHSLTPLYMPVLGKLWLEQGGVYVVANTRGGGEYGPDWHQAAMKKNRPKAHDDFLSVAEDLIKLKITSPQKLGIKGGSGGGLLVGVAFTQRPDLFKAVICQVPLLDMIRYNQLLAGVSWMAEYGDPDKDDERKVLMSYSPYHNIRAQETYPKVFFITSTKDDRVHPGHARKMAAKMADMNHPFYYFENKEGGHAASANLLQVAHRSALEFVYLNRSLRDTSH